MKAYERIWRYMKANEEGGGRCGKMKAKEGK